MDNNIIDSNNLLVETGESRRLSYEMLFNDVEHVNNNGKNKKGTHEEVSFDKQRKNQEKTEDEWKLKLEKARSEAYQQGLDEGIKKGEEKAISHINQQVEWINNAVSDVENHISELMDDLKPHVATLVFDITEKILGLPVKSEKLGEQVMEEIQNLVTSFDRDIQVKLVVSESDYGFIVRALKELSHSERIQLNKSDELSVGEYTVDTSNERIVKNFKKMLFDFREEVALEDFELEIGE